MSEIVKFDCQNFSVIENDPRFIACKFYFGLIGDNSNGSTILEEDYENNKSSIGYTPICGYFNGLDFQEHNKGEKPLGIILSPEDCDYKYEEYDGKRYASAKGIILKEYLTKESESILLKGNKKISIEIEVFEKQKQSNGKFRFTKFLYHCITVLGDYYLEGMEKAHLDVLNSKNKYSSFIEHAKEVFSNKNFIDNKLNKEGDEMNKAVEKFGLNSSQIIELLEAVLSPYKYKNGDYEYRKYWVSSFDETYVYVYDNENDIRVRMTYNIENNIATVNIESAEQVIVGNYVPVNTPNDNGEIESMRKEYCDMKTQFEEMSAKYAEYQEMCNKYQDMSNQCQEMCSKNETMTKEFSTKEETFTQEKVTMSAQIDEKTNVILTMGTELDKFKAENQKFVEDITQKDELIAKFAKEKKEGEAEKILSKYSQKLSEGEMMNFKSEIEKFENIEDFEIKVKAFVCDKYADEINNRNTNVSFSYMDAFTQQNKGKTANKTNWESYIPEYLKTEK
jgi:hypothetical protein